MAVFKAKQCEQIKQPELDNILAPSHCYTDVNRISNEFIKICKTELDQIESIKMKKIYIKLWKKR